MVKGLGPQPAGVAMPPINGPQAQEIIRALPKLLLCGSTLAFLRMVTPIGSSTAATAISVIQALNIAPVISTAKIIALGL